MKQAGLLSILLLVVVLTLVDGVNIHHLRSQHSQQAVSVAGAQEQVVLQPPQGGLARAASLVVNKPVLSRTLSITSSNIQPFATRTSASISYDLGWRSRLACSQSNNVASCARIVSSAPRDWPQPVNHFFFEALYREPERELTDMEKRVKALPEWVNVYHTVNEEGLKAIELTKKIKLAVVDKLIGTEKEVTDELPGVWAHRLDPQLKVEHPKRSRSLGDATIPAIVTREDEILSVCYGELWGTRKDAGYGKHTIYFRIKKSQFATIKPKTNNNQIMLMMDEDKQYSENEKINIVKLYVDGDGLNFADFAKYGMEFEPEIWKNNQKPANSKFKPEN